MLPVACVHARQHEPIQDLNFTISPAYTPLRGIERLSEISNQVISVFNPT